MTLVRPRVRALLPLTGDLDALKTLATSGFGWSVKARERWARRTEDLAGGGVKKGAKKLADVLTKVPTGRLVMLGEPGTGKTMLMVGLVLDLLDPATAAAASRSRYWLRWHRGIRSARICTAG